MTRAVICDGCDDVVVDADDAPAMTSLTRRDGDEWAEADLCPDCTSDDVAELLDEHAEPLHDDL